MVQVLIELLMFLTPVQIEVQIIQEAETQA